MFRESDRSAYYATETFIRDLAPRVRMGRAGRRQVNYRSRSTRRTLDRQEIIRELLATTPGGLTVAEVGAALGISRQLALYHVKKMAATYQLTMQLEPCLGNGGLQYRCWDEMQLAVRYARRLQEAA